ncbi:MAG: hypothetical protein P8N60_08260 [Burkholderiaceae bacterium]|nr:hypothetical protein [Burkholderiaceae bacterium]
MNEAITDSVWYLYERLKTAKYFKGCLLQLAQLLGARYHQAGRGRATENAEDT